MPTIAVDSGTLHLATVDGGAMFFHNSLDFSAYAGTDAGFTPYKITFTDAAGKIAEAWAAAAGGGETLGAEIMVNGDFSGTWVGEIPQGWSLIGVADANNYIVKDDVGNRVQIVSDGTNIRISQLPEVASGVLFKIAVTVDSITNGNMGFFGFGNGIGATFGAFTAAGVKTYYANHPVDRTLYLSQFVGYSCDAWVSNTSVKQLTDVPATGLHLMSASGGTTRNMDTIEVNFNPNTVVSVALEPIRLFVDITEAESTALESLRDNTTVAGWNDSDGWVDGDGTYDGKAASTSQITVAGGVVTALDLRANNLVGEFTAAVVSALTSCATINVSLNPDLNCSFDLDDLPASVTSLNISDTDSDMAGGDSAMSAVAIEGIRARRAGLNSGSVAGIIDRIYADRASFTYANPILRIDNEDTFEFAVNNTQVISGQFSGDITVHWGDGTSDSYSGTDQAWSKDYGSAGNRIVRIERASNLTKFTMTEAGADISFNLADLPSILTYFRCEGPNTVSGNLADLPSGLTYFYCAGQNTVSGNLADLPSGLEIFLCTGSNTVSGNLADLPSILTYFRCYGSNTVSGNLADLPSGLTDFYCTGQNTVSGNLADLPSGLTDFYCAGLNTIDTYVTKTWTTKPATFILVPVSPGGLDGTEVNQLLIDLDNTFDWTTGTITLIGTNAAPTGAGLTAVNNMDAEGATVTVNS